MMLLKNLNLLLSASFLAMGAPLPALAQQGSFQGTSLLGKPMITRADRNVGVADVATLERAARDAKIAFEKNMTVDNATWYGRILFYQGYVKESAAVYNTALQRFPNSGKLLRHLAHRQFSLRQFNESIATGLKAAKLYEGQPLEREKPGPDYFPGTPDVVQYYLYYHLGQAFFAKHQYKDAAHWFAKSAESAAFTHDVEAKTANTYWEYLSLARGGHIREAQRLLDGYQLNLWQVHPNGGSDTYFDGIQLFKGHRAANSFFSKEDSGRAFATADGVAASTAYSLANYYILRGEVEKAKPWLQRSISVDSWSFFARVQAEADWVMLFPGEQPSV
jgi:tetratricopeptide (TPR) repeat protein